MLWLYGAAGAHDWGPAQKGDLVAHRVPDRVARNPKAMGFGREYEESGFMAVVAVHGLLCLVPLAYVFKQ